MFTYGLMRGIKVIDMEAPVCILVGGATGRTFNEVDEPIDNLGPHNIIVELLAPYTVGLQNYPFLKRELM